ncbi:MAG: hypothetical protein AAF447_27555, partial [Myxococcota bacterium]
MEADAEYRVGDALGLGLLLGFDFVKFDRAPLRLETIGMVFKNTEVLRDATWGVQTGDRVGLVGANGGG